MVGKLYDICNGRRITARRQQDYIRSWQERAEGRRSLEKVPVCRHRSDSFTEVEVFGIGCCNSGTVAVYGCGLHGDCVPTSRLANLAGVSDCSTCGDFET